VKPDTITSTLLCCQRAAIGASLSATMAAVGGHPDRAMPSGVVGRDHREVEPSDRL
jgi:hypothetical protein